MQVNTRIVHVTSSVDHRLLQASHTAVYVSFEHYDDADLPR